MADLGNGIYLTTAAERRWQPDTEIGGQAELLLANSGTTAGLWRADPSVGGVAAEPVTIPARETIYIIRGSVRITAGISDSFDLGAGDMISLPGGASIGWAPTDDCEVFWMYA